MLYYNHPILPHSEPLNYIPETSTHYTGSGGRLEQPNESLNPRISMFNFPSGKPTKNVPSNKYTHGRKARQRIAIQKAKEIEILKKRPILDLTTEELYKLLNTL